VFAAGTPTPLPQGLERMAAWAKSVGARQTPRFDAIEIRRGLPESWR
jgi:UDP-glucose 4-epimerase